MKSSSNPVLVYGKDLLLMETRRLMFQAAGFHATTAFTLAEAEAVLLYEPETLLVLCHTLTAARCEAALHMAYSHRHGSKSLVLSAGLPVCKLDREDELLSSFDGPRTLIATIDRMLKANNEAKTSSNTVMVKQSSADKS